MVAVRNRLMPAVRAVHVLLGVLTALVLWRAGRRVGRADRQGMIVHVVVVDMVEVAVVQIILVVTVPHRLVAAPRSVSMAVSLVHLAVTLPHLIPPPGFNLAPSGACG